MTGQGSAGNVIAALCSFFMPGLGQLVQGRILIALVMFFLAAILWPVGLVFLVPIGALVNLWATIDAAVWQGPR